MTLFSTMKFTRDRDWSSQNVGGGGFARRHALALRTGTRNEAISEPTW